MSAWLLPAHIADALPAEARRLEELRRVLLDTAKLFGCELVMPPLLEYLDSLLTGTGKTLDLQTFKLVDQLTGRTLGLRADTTPQVARIDAHLLNRRGVTRLCYSGPVLHTRPMTPGSSREPLQFGAEVYGHSGLEADLEVLQLALACLQAADVPFEGLRLELADIRVVRGLFGLAGETATPAIRQELSHALAKKDGVVLKHACAGLPPSVARAFAWLLKASGGSEVIAIAKEVLPDHPLIHAALTDLAWLVQRLAKLQVAVSIDLSELSADGHAYYSGMRFACYAPGAPAALLRGGRYDEVGAVFGRSRPAVGFGLDVRELATVSQLSVGRSAIRAPWDDSPGLEDAVRQLRGRGETVVRMLPGHDGEADEFECDRELVLVDGQWLIKSAC